jgi:hypothetical protein
VLNTLQDAGKPVAIEKSDPGARSFLIEAFGFDHGT